MKCLFNYHLNLIVLLLFQNEHKLSRVIWVQHCNTYCKRMGHIHSVYMVYRIGTFRALWTNKRLKRTVEWNINIDVRKWKLSALSHKSVFRRFPYNVCAQMNNTTIKYGRVIGRSSLNCFEPSALLWWHRFWIIRCIFTFYFFLNFYSYSARKQTINIYRYTHHHIDFDPQNVHQGRRIWYRCATIIASEEKRTNKYAYFRDFDCRKIQHSTIFYDCITFYCCPSSPLFVSAQHFSRSLP